MPRPQDIWFDHLESATHYNQWIFSKIQPHLQGKTLEVGCGSGNFTPLIAQHCTELLAVDLNADYVQQTQARMQQAEHVTVLTADATRLGDHPELAETVANQGFETIIMLDVLEHIETDVAVLHSLGERLAPQGNLIVKVPAVEGLYNSLDRAVGHHCRYSPKRLKQAFIEAGFAAPDLAYFNLVGIAGWWLNGLRQRQTPPGQQVGWFDQSVPLFQALEARLGCPVGLSLFAIARSQTD
ncbi:MAG: class I SAM-dependent methyltransferase [Cyanobacteria bacterium J06649_5]